MKQHMISVCFAIATFVCIVTCSIAVPIYVRPFYFWHINLLHLEKSGYSVTQIKEAYNEILDYLTLPQIHTFRAGDFPFSESGAAHFADCKVLFTLNTILLLFSALFLIIIIIRKKTKSHSNTIYWTISCKFLCSNPLSFLAFMFYNTCKYRFLQCICYISFNFLSRKRKLDFRLSHRSYYQCHAANIFYALCNIDRNMHCYHFVRDYNLANI